MKFILACLLLSSSVALGGGVDTRGGGGGVLEDQAVYSLDLAEAGVEKSPYISNQQADVAFVADLAGHGLSIDFPIELVAQVIGELEHIDAGFAAGLLEGAKALQWSFVDLPLAPSPDLENLIFSKQAVQLAVRQGPMVRIQRQLWLKMDLQNRAALIVHEVLAALAPTNFQPTQIRRLVGDLFTSAFYKGENPDLIKQELNGYPSAQSLQQPSPLYSRYFPLLAGSPLTKGSVFHFSPKFLLKSSEVGGIKQLFGRSRFTYGESLIFNGSLSLPDTSFCDAKKLSEQVLTAQFETQLLKVSFPPVSNDIEPHLDWTFVNDDSYPFIIFLQTKGTYQANCSPGNRATLTAIDLWSDTLALGELP